VKRVDANTIETTWTKDGKTVMKTHAVVSSDGKTQTVTFDGTDPQGHKVHNVVVFGKGM
jgi:N-methylhydantoinase B/oxoprolinase/acetone carboxylase alpha subunit